MLLPSDRMHAGDTFTREVGEFSQSHVQQVLKEIGKLPRSWSADYVFNGQPSSLIFHTCYVCRVKCVKSA
jgi:hypothetical protein